MRGAEEVRQVQALAAQGLGATEVARRTGVPRGTVRHGLAGELPGLARPDACARCGTAHDTPPAAPYAYAFGMYLGDGCILRHPRGVWRLEIVLDSIYPGIVAECAGAVRLLLPDKHVAVVENHGRGRYVIVRSYSKSWPCLFPQHGPGRKHERTSRSSRGRSGSSTCIRSSSYAA